MVVKLRYLFSFSVMLIIFISIIVYDSVGFASLGLSLDELIIGFGGASDDIFDRLKSLVRNFEADINSVVRINNGVEAVSVRLPVHLRSAFISKVSRIFKPLYIESNHIYRACFVPNDEYWSLQWGFRKIQVDFAWNISVGNSSILVSVVDTGVDWNHPDLAANYVALGYDWVNDDSDPVDDNGHGTHVAGIVAAVINNSIGVAGLSQVKIMAEKALNSTGYGSTDDLANAIIHSVDSGAKIIVMSWGDYYDSFLLHNAIRYAYSNNVLLVAAAGNDAVSEPMYPAAYSEVVAVSATDRWDNLASFSNFGDWIELAAPGVSIFSTVWDDSYAYKSGTSMAASFVAGVAALTWSVYPQLSRDDLRIYLREKADDLGSPGFDIYFGYGRVNAWKALENSTKISDIAVFGVVPGKAVVGQGMRMRVYVNVTNLGYETEVFNVTLYANRTEANCLEMTLQAGESINLTFEWNTAAFSFGRYLLSCCVDPLSNEYNVSNNDKNSSVFVWVAMIGDITGLNPGEPDGKVDIRDVALVARLCGSFSSDRDWNPNADVNDDDKIDLRDVSLTASNFGKKT